MRDDLSTFEDLIVGVDGRPGGRDAIALAKRLVAPSGRITLVHIYRSDSMLGRGATPLERQEAEALVSRERETADLDADVVIHGDISAGGGLLSVAEQKAADLVVVGSCHRGPLGRLLLGNDARRVVNAARCAVALAPRGYAISSKPLAKIGVAYDGSLESELALQVAGSLVARNRAVLQPLGRHIKELARFSTELDLLVVGSRTRSPTERLLTPAPPPDYSEWHSACPLLVLHWPARKDDDRDAALRPTDHSIATQR
jgi:nucleotide-binding universal stress UspA family protein